MTLVRETDGVHTLYGMVPPAKDVDSAQCKFTVTDVSAVDQSFREPRPCGVRIGIVGVPVGTWSNCDNSAAKAVDERFVKDHTPFAMRYKDRTKVTRAVKSIIATHYPREVVLATFRDHPIMAELRSPNMDIRVFEQAVDDLLDQMGVLPEYKYMVKNEALVLGKNPRLIINAGNMHQIAALLVISIFEKLWFPPECRDHIKKGSVNYERDLGERDTAKINNLRRTISHLNSGSFVPPKRNGKTSSSVPLVGLEGDGSSWDFCCSKRLRRLIERPILEHILDCILDCECFHELPCVTMKNSIDFASKKKWNMKQSTIDWKDGHKRTMILDIVRASGERGTSSLNHLINTVLWTCCLLDNPTEVLSRADRGASSEGWYLMSRRITGKQKRWIYFRGSYEGDDSLLKTCKFVFDDYGKDITDYWTRAGHRMKLVPSSSTHEKGNLKGKVRGFCVFVGYDILFEASSFLNVFCPSISRNLASQAISTSYYATQEGHDRLCRVLSVGAQAHASRAIAYLPHLPELANLFVAQYEYCNKELEREGKILKANTTVDDQLHFKLGLELGESVNLDELLADASAEYDPSKSDLYDELVLRTTGHVYTLDDKIRLIELSEVSPDDTVAVFAAVPNKFWQPYNTKPPLLPNHFLKVIDKEELGLTSGAN